MFSVPKLLDLRFVVYTLPNTPIREHNILIPSINLLEHELASIEFLVIHPSPEK